MHKVSMASATLWKTRNSNELRLFYDNDTLDIEWSNKPATKRGFSGEYVSAKAKTFL